MAKTKLKSIASNPEFQKLIQRINKERAVSVALGAKAYLRGANAKTIRAHEMAASAYAEARTAHEDLRSIFWDLGLEKLGVEHNILAGIYEDAIEKHHNEAQRLIETQKSRK